MELDLAKDHTPYFLESLLLPTSITTIKGSFLDATE
jgi:hypothetical protein